MKYMSTPNGGGGYEYRTLELIEAKGEYKVKTVTINGPCLLYTGALTDYCSVNIICDDVSYVLKNRSNTQIVIPMEKPTIARGTTSTLLFAPYCVNPRVVIGCLQSTVCSVVHKLEWVSGLNITCPSNGEDCYIDQLFAEKSLTINFDASATENSLFVIKKLIKI